jgi:hypothetical protein
MKRNIRQRQVLLLNNIMLPQKQSMLCFGTNLNCPKFQFLKPFSLHHKANWESNPNPPNWFSHPQY